jgi:hypothetical protein
MEAFRSPYGYYGDELVSALPPSLTLLALSASSCITNDSIYLYIQHFHALTTFVCFSPAISGSSFPFLPRLFTQLILPASTIIVDEEMIHLPSTLESLHLNSARALTDACGPALPKKLRVFHLDDNELVSPTLPRISTLRSLLCCSPSSFLLSGKPKFKKSKYENDAPSARDSFYKRLYDVRLQLDVLYDPRRTEENTMVAWLFLSL